MNAIAACNAERKFIFFSWGGEGSAHDSTVLFNSDEYKKWPKGCYMLFDAGVTCQFGKVLSPYKKVAYHLAEIQPTGGEPLKKKELFNLRHSVKRSGAIECAFGVLKQRFAILRRGFKATKKRTDLIIHVSVCMLVTAVSKLALQLCALLHNYLIHHNGFEHVADSASAFDPQLVSSSGEASSTSATSNALAWREGIADEMHTDYIAHLSRTGRLDRMDLAEASTSVQNTWRSTMELDSR